MLARREVRLNPGEVPDWEDGRKWTGLLPSWCPAPYNFTDNEIFNKDSDISKRQHKREHKAKKKQNCQPCPAIVPN